MFEYCTAPGVGCISKLLKELNCCAMFKEAGALIYSQFDEDD